MAIYEYEEGEHGGGFIGLRVAVMAGKKHNQRYFSLNNVSGNGEKRIRQEAELLNKDWLVEKEKALVKRTQESKEQRPVNGLHTTGVRGIKMKFGWKNSQYQGKPTRYYTPFFVVSGQNHKGRFHRNFNILAHGYQNAWTFAVLYYAMRKNIQEPQQLVKRLPPPEKFLIIYKALCARGHQVPKKRLPIEVYQKLNDYV